MQKMMPSGRWSKPEVMDAIPEEVGQYRYQVRDVGQFSEWTPKPPEQQFKLSARLSRILNRKY